MNFATIKPFDVANGPGVRVSLFVSGCTHRCKGCFNEEAWDFAYGEEDGTLIEDTLADSDSLEYNKRFFERMALREAIARMNEQWQKILVLRFFRNKTQQQVANILGLTQVKVSREEKKIVEFLRKELS